MTEINRTTQETTRGTGAAYTGAGTAAAAQKAPQPSGPPTANKPSGSSNMPDVNEMVDHAKQTVSEAYEQATRSVNETLGHAKEYSRENPGTATLVAFGVGVGVGVLLANGMLNSSRSRSQRIVPPVMTALSEIATELFRR
ncbi:MAG: hypothetical protein HOP19_19915 [Acidobacteria bacterium]|nr:hypothetical protein [Acidobacteriota bacterium]